MHFEFVLPDSIAGMAPCLDYGSINGYKLVFAHI